jgi:hypothetical protein
MNYLMVLLLLIGASAPVDGATVAEGGVTGFSLTFVSDVFVSEVSFVSSVVLELSGFSGTTIVV